jgi:hypothetical protein
VAQAATKPVEPMHHHDIDETRLAGERAVGSLMA